MKVVGLEGVLASEAKEFNDELELLLDPILLSGLPAFSMLSMRDFTDCLLH